MTETAPPSRRFKRSEVFVLVSHLALALVATLAFELIQQLPLYLRLTIALIYVASATGLFIRLRRREVNEVRSHERRVADDLRQALGAKISALAAEKDEWRRLELLTSRTLAIVNEFLKDRYKLYHCVAASLREEVAVGSRVDLDTLIKVLGKFDAQRVPHIKQALRRVSSALVEDLHKKPERASTAVQDHFKVSYYAVKPPIVGSAHTEERLEPEYRFYPNEGQPKTPFFAKGEGGAGVAWAEERIVVFEDCSTDDRFTEKRDKQRSEYASMICVPAIEDVPEERYHKVCGVLTVDTPIRVGYFSKDMARFWADLMEPIGNILIYAKEAEGLTEAVVKGIVGRSVTTERAVPTAETTPGLDVRRPES
jgi:hypothetical protein